MNRLLPARQGDHGDDIAWVQKRLGHVPADGVFDEVLAARVRGFQWAWGIAPSGLLDDETWAKLREGHE